MAGTKTKNVTLKMEAGHVVAVPSKLPNMHVGDTLTFNSKEPLFKVEFKGRWPFGGEKHEVKDNEPLTFEREGPFKFLCYIGAKPEKHPQPGGGYRVSSGRIVWKRYPGDSGGTGSVKPPGK
jgi:hypothetical protein